MYNFDEPPHYTDLAAKYDEAVDTIKEQREELEDYDETLQENVHMSQFLLEMGYNGNQRHAIKTGQEVDIEPVDKGKFDLMKIRLELSDIKVLLKEKS